MHVYKSCTVLSKFKEHKCSDVEQGCTRYEGLRSYNSCALVIHWPLAITEHKAAHYDKMDGLTARLRTIDYADSGCIPEYERS